MKVLIVGLGSISKKHIAALSSSYKQVDIFALRNEKTATSVESVVNIFDLKDAPKDLDFAIISNPTIKHFETIKSLLSLKIPLFIEKPSIHSLEGAEALVNEIEALNIKTYVACNLRFLDCLNFVKESIKNGRISEINEVNIYAGSFLPDWRPNVDFKKVYSAIPELGGGVHLDLIHELDYAFWLFGTPTSTQKTLKANSSLGIASTCYANYLLEYTNFCANITLNYFRKVPKRSLEIVYDDKVWEINLLKNSVSENGKVIFESQKTILDTYNPQILHFTKNMNNNNFEFENSFKNSIEVLKICLND